jgi:hypothetical protein
VDLDKILNPNQSLDPLRQLPLCDGKQYYRYVASLCRPDLTVSAWARSITSWVSPRFCLRVRDAFLLCPHYLCVDVSSSDALEPGVMEHIQLIMGSPRPYQEVYLVSGAWSCDLNFSQIGARITQAMADSATSWAVYNLAAMYWRAVRCSLCFFLESQPL